MGTQLPLPKGAQPPQFLAHICCGQMAAWIKKALGVELGLGLGDFVLDGDLAPPPQKGRSPPPKNGQCLLWPNRWMDKLVLGMCCPSGSLPYYMCVLKILFVSLSLKNKLLHFFSFDYYCNHFMSLGDRL